MSKSDKVNKSQRKRKPATDLTKDNPRNSKRRKKSTENNSKNGLTLNNNNTGSKSKVCKICNQNLNELKFLDSLPEDAVEEVIALADNKLSFETEIDFLEDFRPTYRLMNFR